MKKKNVLIYGINQQAQQLCAYLRRSEYVELLGFLVDREYFQSDELLGLPVYAREDAFHRFSPKQVEILLSFGYKNMMENRKQKFMLCKEKGYSLYTYVSPDASVYTDQIGEGSIIYPGCVIAPFTTIGCGCFLGIGATLEHHCTIENFCFLATRSALCGNVYVRNNCFLGANCTVIQSTTIAEYTLVGAGAVVTKDTHPRDVCFPPRGAIRSNSSGIITI